MDVQGLSQTRRVHCNTFWTGKPQKGFLMRRQCLQFRAPKALTPKPFNP